MKKASNGDMAQRNEKRENKELEKIERSVSDNKPIVKIIITN